MSLSGPRPRSRGFGHLDVLVSLVIASIAVLAIAHTMGSDAGNASSNTGAARVEPLMRALTGIEHLVGQAGFGLPDLPACELSHAGRSLRVAPLVASAPSGVAVTNESDRLRVLAGSNARLATSVVPQAPMLAAGQDRLAFASTFGFARGDWLLISGDAGAGVACMLARVGQVESDRGVILRTRLPRGISRARVFNLGAQPIWRELSVDAEGRLLIRDLLEDDARPVVLASGVSAMGVQLGLAARDGAGVERWQPAVAEAAVDPANSTPRRVVAVRLGVLMRSEGNGDRASDTVVDASPRPACRPPSALPAVAADRASGAPMMPASAPQSASGACAPVRQFELVAPVGDMRVVEG